MLRKVKKVQYEKAKVLEINIKPCKSNMCAHVDENKSMANCQLPRENMTQSAEREKAEGRCNREKPPCKYFHPPQHLKDQLLINGRNHLALKNAIIQQMGLGPGQPLVPGQVPTVEAQPPGPSHQHLQQQLQQQLLATHALMATNPYLTGMPQVGNTYSPYFAPSPIMPTIMGPGDPTGVGSPLGVVQQTVAMPQKMPRTDRLEVCLPANYMRQVAAHGPPRAPGPPQPAPQPLYQAAANGAVNQAQGPQNRVSPVSTLQSQCTHHNPQSPSPTASVTTTTTLAPPPQMQPTSSCTQALTSVCAPIHNPAHPGALHSPLQNLVYVHAYAYEGPYVPIYVRT
ncbi:hypothetical protein TKK_0013481 [Trichogramma kaykai]